MQAKGLIKFFGIALAIICLFQLSFTWFANRVENAAEEHAQTVVDRAEFDSENAYNAALDRAERNYLLEQENKPAANFLVTSYTYKEAKERQLNLGLDLQGGMSVVLQVTLDGVIKSLSNNSSDPSFLAALENAKVAEQASQDDFVTLFAREFQQINEGPNGLARIFASPSNAEFISYDSSNDAVIDYIRDEAQTAIRTTYEILKTRIDKFGVSQPNVQLIENQGRIIVELPGVDDADRVRKLLQSTANLEFWETREMDNELAGLLQRANQSLGDRNRAEDAQNEPTAASEDDDDAVEETTAVADENGLETADEDSTSLNLDGDLADDSELSDEELRRQNPLFAVMTPNNQIGSPVIGYAAVQDTSALNDYLNDEAVRSALPRNLRLLYSAKPEIETTNEETGEAVNLLAIYAIESPFGGDFTPKLDGTVITDARQDFGSIGNDVIVNMTMNAEGAREWAKMTAANLGQSIAIVLDNQVYSAPRVNDEIRGGSSQISGDFTITEASDLANILKAGKLPAPARIVEATTVGPSLGESSIQAGLLSLLAGLALVLVFMVFYYNKGGVVSVIALLLNLFFIIGVLASLGATLTLPGMAGIVLTIGMAVDANVIIYERIREELARGSSRKKAIADGFSKSYSAIIDANLTTLITAIILAYFGLGPVLGFATILIIGIFSSLFTAVLISRLLIEGAEDRGIHMSFFNSMTEGAFKNLNFDFVSRRKNYYIASGIFILIGLASFAINGFELGVDFQGGRTYVVKFDQNVESGNVSDALADAFGAAPLVTTYGTSDQMKITTAYEINNSSPDIDQQAAQVLYNGVKGLYASAPSSYEVFASENILSSQKVGPTIADDITKGALWATVLSLIGIFCYIAVRFRKPVFGLAAVVTVIHDTLILLTVFSLGYKFLPFGMEINQAFIAALLTVIGYSINDTVVVFDRIREYLNLYSKRPFIKTVNEAINSTFSRTIITSLTTLLVVAILFVFGGEVIRGFSFALLIGILVGTYSSICIATPLVIDLTNATDRSRTPQTQPAKPKAVAG